MGLGGLLIIDRAIIGIHISEIQAFLGIFPCHRYDLVGFVFQSIGQIEKNIAEYFVGQSIDLKIRNAKTVLLDLPIDRFGMFEDYSSKIQPCQVDSPLVADIFVQFQFEIGDSADTGRAMPFQVGFLVFQIGLPAFKDGVLRCRHTHGISERFGTFECLRGEMATWRSRHCFDSIGQKRIVFHWVLEYSHRVICHSCSFQSRDSPFHR